MSARKTERQLDLLFILLNSSRPLSREVIRTKIEEYRNQENQDSFERMFERDKDELRAVGIPIETKSLDPLFDDEFGYELRLENLNLKNSFFNNEELAELTRAALIWEDSVLATSARLGLVKSLTESQESLDYKEDFKIGKIIASHAYVVIAEALVNKNLVEFDYHKPNQTKAVTKRVAPESLFTKKSTIYLKAIDLSDSTVKTFNLSRIGSEVMQFQPNHEDLKIIKNRKVADNEIKQVARIKYRFSPESILHTINGRLVDDWIEVDYFNEEDFAIFIAPLAHQIEKIEPQSLNEAVISLLESVQRTIQ